ncbi:MAG: basic helix-loop-helix protein [Piccolia ochrophora]|nr:MAG: basic helix-loop-helix protein [Piccolia ochrophora]
MSDQAVFAQLQEHNLRADAAREALRSVEGDVQSTHLPHKRKREPSDHEGDHGRGDNNTRRSSFRRASPNNTTIPTDHNSGQGGDLSDPSSNSFLSAQNQSSGQGTGEDDLHHSSATSLDFGNISQHQGGDGSGHQNGSHDPNDATSTAAAALAGIYPTMTVPQPTDISFASSNSGGDGDASFGLGDENSGQHSAQNYDLEGHDGQHHMREHPNAQKPAVGSEEWHRVRRDNHKEVERRRRETINEGINELAKIVPGCEKNKGSILQRAVSFITQLKENESQNIEKWTLEKLLTEQAIAELSASVDKLKNECERAWREAEMWKKACQDAGIDPRHDEPAQGKEGGKDGD